MFMGARFSSEGVNGMRSRVHKGFIEYTSPVHLSGVKRAIWMSITRTVSAFYRRPSSGERGGGKRPGGIEKYTVSVNASEGLLFSFSLLAL